MLGSDSTVSGNLCICIVCKPGDDAGEGKSRDFPQEEEVEEEGEEEEEVVEEELGETEEEGRRTSLISYPGRELSSTDLDRSPFAYCAQIRKRDNGRCKFIFCVSKQICRERRTNDVNNADFPSSPSKAVEGAGVN